MIKINKVEKYQAFPLIPQRSKKSVDWKDNTDSFGITLIIHDYMLEDLIEFQLIEFEVIRGYYLNEGLDVFIQPLYKHICTKRRMYKKQKIPLKQVYKLLMNNSYGKMTCI